MIQKKTQEKIIDMPVDNEVLARHVNEGVLVDVRKVLSDVLLHAKDVERRNGGHAPVRSASAWVYMEIKISYSSLLLCGFIRHRLIVGHAAQQRQQRDLRNAWQPIAETAARR